LVSSGRERPCGSRSRNHGKATALRRSAERFVSLAETPQQGKRTRALARGAQSGQPSSMRFALGFFLPVAAAIVAFWWWLGLPVAMPLSPLAPGEKLPCVSYTPFRTLTAFGEATPAATAAQIETDLALLAPVTSC